MDETEMAQRLDEMSRLLTLICRRLGPEQESLQDFVVELAKVGLPPARIAALAGTTSNYASVALSRARKRGT